MHRPIIATLLLTMASWSYAARLGAPRRVGPVGTAPAVSLLGTVLPFGDGHVVFTAQRVPDSASPFEIVATPIDRNGVVQYDRAQTIASHATSEPLAAATASGASGPTSGLLAAATDSGYLLCWGRDHQVFTLALSPSLQPRANAISLGKDIDIAYYRFACNGSRCLLTLASTVYPYEEGSIIVLDTDGVQRSHRSLVRAGYPTFSALAPVNGGFAFFHGPSSAGTYPSGITWLDTDGNATGETALPNLYASAIVAHPAGALVVSQVGGSGGAEVRAVVVSPDRGIVKSGAFTVGSGYSDITGVTIGGDGANYLIAVSRTTYPPMSPSPPLPSDVGGILVTGDLQVIRPWFPIAEQWEAQTAMCVSPNGGYLVAWQRSGSYAHSSAVTSNGSVLQPDGAAIVRGPAVQQALGLAASPTPALPVWNNHAAEPYLNAERAPAQFARIDGAGGTPDAPPLTMDIGYVHAVWNGSAFAVFGSHLIDSRQPVDVTGGTIDASGNVQQALIGREMQVLNAWWDGSAYVAVTYPTVSRDSHILHIASDLAVVSDARLFGLASAAAGVPGRMMIVSQSPGQPSLTFLDDRNAPVAITTLTVPQYSHYVAASNGSDQFLLVVVDPFGTTYASRFTRDGKQLDDLTTPLMNPGEPLVEALGDRWILLSPGGAMEFPSRKPLDLSAAGTIVRMARASFDRIVLLTRETIISDGLPLQVLMLRDLIDDPPRRRAAH